MNKNINKKNAILVILSIFSLSGPVACDNSALANSRKAPLARFLSQGESVPDFSQIKDSQAKKAAFIEFMHPLILRANEEVMAERERMLSMHKVMESGRSLRLSQTQWLYGLASKYKIRKMDVTDQRFWDELKKRVDIVPAPLALAQAAAESGWGTSRFAVEANNYFGHACFDGRRARFTKNLSKKVAAGAEFESVFDAVQSYVHNLNSHNAYKKVRAMRANMRDSGKDIRAQDLAMGLEKYSSRGHDYVRDLRALMRQNQLNNYKSLQS